MGEEERAEQIFDSGGGRGGGRTEGRNWNGNSDSDDDNEQKQQSQQSQQQNSHCHFIHLDISFITGNGLKIIRKSIKVTMAAASHFFYVFCFHPQHSS